MQLNQLPHVLTAGEIASYLRIGRKRVYELMQIPPSHGGIPSFSVGRSRRVEKAEFLRWLDQIKKTG